MFNKQGIALICSTVGLVLSGFMNLHFIPGIFFLAALVLSISELVEEYKSSKSEKEQKNGSGRVE